MTRLFTEKTEIDQQHSGIERQMDLLLNQLANPATPAESVHDVLRDLLIAVGMHFGFEEGLMEAAGYPQFDHHRRQHMAIMTELGLMLDRVGEPDSTSQSIRGVEFLQRWLQEHIGYSDKAMETWFTSRA